MTSINTEDTHDDLTQWHLVKVNDGSSNKRPSLVYGWCFHYEPLSHMYSGECQEKGLTVSVNTVFSFPRKAGLVP